MKNFSLKNNIVAYLVSMRWPYSFISGMAAWIGIIFCGINPDISKQIIVLSIAFIGWGVNQVINDYLGINEDRINAPNRPMVTGQLDIRFALTMSTILGMIGLIVTYQLNREALIFYLFVFGLNIVYERTKRMPLLGNIFFGLLIAPCIYWAAMCVGARRLLDVLFDSKLASLAILVWLSNFVLCFFTDFKDFKGDKKTGVRTLVVVLGIHKAKYLGFILIAIPFLCLYYFLKLSLLFPYLSNIYFLVMIVLSFLSFLYPAILFSKYPGGKSTYYSLKWVIMAVTLFQTALIGLVNPYLSTILFMLNLICIYLLFSLYKDYRA
ncbi:MAG: UbiA family prenyltransferase [Candidatus Omnitrophica bacterium]|nr:UbiA family prenyltransferase [Candidatus Omnitrophota bacterium]